MFAARSVFLPLVLAAAACAAETTSGTSLPRQSPFLPPGGAAPTAAPAETLEFTGVSLIGTKADLVFHDKAAKKSHWIAEGDTKDGIAVLRYDARRQQAVVKVNGVEKVLSLRKGSGPVNAPAAAQPLPTGFNVPVANAAVPVPVGAPVPPAAAPVASAPVPTAPVAAATKPDNPATPEAQVKAETEARMLVSDLLEIGMAQRKAYEEAQRKAAEGNASPTPAPGATQPSAGTPAQPEKPNGN